MGMGQRSREIRNLVLPSTPLVGIGNCTMSENTSIVMNREKSSRDRHLGMDRRGAKRSHFKRDESNSGSSTRSSRSLGSRNELGKIKNLKRIRRFCKDDKNKLIMAKTVLPMILSLKRFPKLPDHPFCHAHLTSM